MTVRAYGSGVFERVITAICKAHDVMNLEKGFIIFPPKRRILPANLANTASKYPAGSHYICIPYKSCYFNDDSLWLCGRPKKALLNYVNGVAHGLGNSQVEGKI